MAGKVYGAFGPEGCVHLSAAGCVERDGKKVQKVQRGRFLSLMGPSGPKVLRFDSGKAAEGCGIALRAMSMKSALRYCLPALIVILSRRRRISVQAAYETNAIKYRSAGRLFYAFLWLHTLRITFQ